MDPNLKTFCSSFLSYQQRWSLPHSRQDTGSPNSFWKVFVLKTPWVTEDQFMKLAKSPAHAAQEPGWDAECCKEQSLVYPWHTTKASQWAWDKRKVTSTSPKLSSTRVWLAGHLHAGLGLTWPGESPELKGPPAKAQKVGWSRKTEQWIGRHKCYK